jgi:hypothetical protein
MKTFECKHHPKEQIQRVCSELDCDNTLCCIECILSTHGAQHKESLTSISDFVEKVAKHYESLRRIKSNEDAPPLEFTDFLSKEDENLAKLSGHVEKEKAVVETTINELLSTFTQLCFKTKEDMFRQLDAQVSNLRANYKYYQNKLNKFYSKSDEDNLNPTKEEIVSKMNRAQKLEEFEFIIKNIKDDISESKIVEGTMDQKVQAIKSSIREMADVLKQQANSTPLISYKIESDLNTVLKEFKEDCEPFFEEKLSLSNSIAEFNMSNIVMLDSKIVKSAEQSMLLKKWISNGMVRFKLLYRGTRDGFTAAAFHKKTDKVKPTITICQSNVGNKIFGGFTDTDWTVTNNYKNTTGTFLFSLTEKEKYALKPNMQQYAMYSNASYLATFGGGFDFYLCDNCNTSNASYSNFGHSYDTKGKAKEVLCGAYNFTVKEVEVYQVDFTGELQIQGANKKGKKSK